MQSQQIIGSVNYHALNFYDAVTPLFHERCEEFHDISHIIFLTNKSALVSTSARLCCSCIVSDYYTFFLNDLLCNRCCNKDSVVRALITFTKIRFICITCAIILRNYCYETRWDCNLQRCVCVCVCVRVCVSQSIAKSKHKAAPVLPITLSLINHEREYSESNFIVRCNIP